MSDARIEKLLKKAWTLFEAGQVDLALEQCEQALALAPESDALELEAGVLLYRAERFEAALARFERAAARSPGNPVAHQNAAKALLELERAAEALAAAERGLAVDAAHAGLVIAAGLAELALDRADAALARFVRATELKPRHGEAWRQRAVALRRLGRLEDALAAISEACAVQPNVAEALWERARVQRGLGRSEDAWKNLVAAIKVRGDASERRLLLDAGEVACELRGYGDAVKLAEKLIARDRDDAAAWLLKGRALRGAGDEARGLACEGTGHMIAGALDDAFQVLRAAVDLQPKYTAAWCNLAVVLERKGRLEDALALYDEALSHDRTAATVWHNKGALLLGKLGRTEEAIACFRQEVKLDHRRWFDLQPEVRKLLGSP